MADSPTKDKRLSVTSSHYDIGKKGFLNDEEKQVRAMDINGEGAVSAEFAITLVKQNSALNAEIQKLQTRQLIMYVIVLACCVATVISSIVGAEQAKDTMINDQGNLVSKFNGAPIETSEALEDTGSTGFADMTNDELADLKYISSDEKFAHLAVKGHVRNGDSSVTLLVEGGTVTFNNDGYFNSTGETGTLLKAALGDFFIEDTDGNRVLRDKADKKNKNTDKWGSQSTKKKKPTNWTRVRGTHWADHSDPGGCAVPAFNGMEYRDDAIAVGDLRALGSLMIKTEPEGRRNCGQLYDIQCTNFAGVTGPTISAVVVSTCDVSSYGCGVDMITSTWNKVTKNADFGEADCTAVLNKSSIFKNHEGMVCSFRSTDNCGDCQSNLYYTSVGLVNTKGKIVVSVSADGQSMRNNDNYNQFWDGEGGNGPYKGSSEFVFTFEDGNTHTCLYKELQKPSNVHIW